MHFPRKSFGQIRSIILSDKPLVAMQLEERISKLIPAFESSLDSFENYSGAYEHCSQLRTVGLFFLHYHEQSSFPPNTIDELAAPFEAIDSLAGLFILADNEKAFTEAYRLYGHSERLLGICLHADLSNDLSLKNKIYDVLQRYELRQKKLSIPQEEIELFIKMSRRFGDIELMIRITQILTGRIDRNWFDDLIVEAGPCLLLFPDDQLWILNNSSGLSKVSESLMQFKELTAQELILSKDSASIVIRAVLLSHFVYLNFKDDSLESFLTENTRNVSSFAPTLKKILAAEKMNLIGLLKEGRARRVA